ncbi:aminodeoxychorismate synthase component I [Streptomyces sp. SID8352]|uniref:aminodeoxychorismate synthase component I n=1 Tax=Streptomyces sp. SID8352 TaxID=2690338 RepID=UPI00136CCCFB|nr:aminodeoxychorismate synthase component I [Streptomyces sp. SID8352]MYU25790.1 aminodeoxychorismate synthase component I [Streptomyces sp. SID8352]
MRTLLVDNYDSFTFNLFHLLAEANGQEPVVIRNDEPGWRTGQLQDFDNVVLSPGPGTPGRPEDFGICTDIVRAADRPVLGVCLGHQGIALLNGAPVLLAPEPRHGRVSPVEHLGTDLFAGIPSPFDVVRYHSLTVGDLPADTLEATAWTPDGILMGLRHRRLPLWGVQFHPESISSEHGLRLVRNFRDLTARWQEKHGARSSAAPAGPARATVGETAAPPRRLRVLTEELPTAWDPEVVFEELLRGGNHAFWLDSSRADGGLGRFSIMGDASGELARVASADVASGTVTVMTGNRSTGEPFATRRDFLDWIDDDLRSLRVDVPPLPCDFALGWVGYLGYELKAQCGAGPVVHHPEEPDATMVFAARALVFDHLTGTTHLLALAPGDDATDAAGDLGGAGAVGGAGGADAGGADDLGGTGPAGGPGGADAGGAGAPGGSGRTEGAGGTDAGADAGGTDAGSGAGGAEAAPGAGGAAAEARGWLRTTAERLRALAGQDPAPVVPPQSVHADDLRLRHDREAYLERIRRSQEDITAGETYEVCLTNMVHSETKIDPWDGYRFLRRASPAPFASLLLFGDLSVLSTSPERFLRIGADGLAESKPIKGTRPRGATTQEDEALRADLRSNEKDRSENLMIVDLVRNDLGRCAEVGSVHVHKLFDVETYATVHQLVSTVRARLRKDTTAVECVRAAFPGGSMTGAPKIRTMQIIDALEEGPRGVYSGAIGYFSLSGAADLSIVIRTAVITPTGIRYGVGGAIVALSDPDAEYEETITKTAPLLRLLDTGFPGREPRGLPTAARPVAGTVSP